MKKTTMKMLGTLAIAAALAMTTGLTACSSENELTETPNAEQPGQPTDKGVRVTVTAGISDGATTRSEVTKDGTTRTLKFTAGDRLYIYGVIRDDNPDYDSTDPNSYEYIFTALYGYLDIDETSIDADGTTASFSGTLHTKDLNTHAEDAYDFKGADPLAACNFDNGDYGEPAHAYLVHSDATEGTDYGILRDLNFIISLNDSWASDVETLMTKRLYVMGRYDKDTQGFTLSSNKAILNCTLSGLKADHDYTLNLTTKQPYVNNNSFAIKTDENGSCAIAIATYSGNYERTITIKDGETEVGTIDLGTRDMTAKVYNVKRNYGRAAFGKFVDISTLSGDYTAQDGDVLTGTLANNVKISIAAGAMVTLSGARINDNDEGTDRHWTAGNYAGLTFLGDATIVLADGTTNTVRNFGDSYPGIQAAHNDTGSGDEYTLTIRGGSLGTGELIARCHDDGAGIGSGYIGSCGHITIEGGTVTANGGGDGAGIGSGILGTCGNITISGGTVTATGDPVIPSEGGAGIGSGYIGSCGNITISGGRVNATGSVYCAGIGSGGSINNDKGSCDNISITGGIVTATGGKCGAGIGSGESEGLERSTCGNITITLYSGSINVDRNPAASTQYVTVTADRNNGNRGGGLYDIGKGFNGTIKDGENNGTVKVGSNVKTIGGGRYSNDNLSDGWIHD